jgi:phospho-N-acetylmuramoyl-pentapeptide-transferase
MGGLIVLAGMLVALGYSLLTTKQPAMAGMTIYLVLIVLFALIGFVDDFLVPRLIKGSRGLGWKQKILMQIILAAVPIALLERTGLKSTLVAVFIVLFYANAYNFTDGLDGLAGSVGVALIGGLGVLSMLVGTEQTLVVPVVGAAIIGGLIPFLLLNCPPAKLFMGDVGSLPIGAAIGLMVWQLGCAAGSVGAGSVTQVWLALGVMSLVMVAELVPQPIQIASVKLRKGKRVFKKTPIHHGFQADGIAETRIVGAYALCQTVLSALGLSAAIWLGSVAFHWSMAVK